MMIICLIITAVLGWFIYYRRAKYIYMRIVLALTGFKVTQVVRQHTLRRGYVKDHIELTYEDDLKHMTLKELWNMAHSAK